MLVVNRIGDVLDDGVTEKCDRGHRLAQVETTPEVLLKPEQANRADSEFKNGLIHGNGVDWNLEHSRQNLDNPDFGLCLGSLAMQAGIV